MPPQLPPRPPSPVWHQSSQESTSDVSENPLQPHLARHDDMSLPIGSITVTNGGLPAHQYASPKHQKQLSSKVNSIKNTSSEGTLKQKELDEYFRTIQGSGTKDGGKSKDSIRKPTVTVDELIKHYSGNRNSRKRETIEATPTPKRRVIERPPKAPEETKVNFTSQVNPKPQKLDIPDIFKNV